MTQSDWLRVRWMTRDIILLLVALTVLGLAFR